MLDMGKRAPCDNDIAAICKHMLMLKQSQENLFPLSLQDVSGYTYTLWEHNQGNDCECLSSPASETYLESPAPQICHGVQAVVIPP
jgi:hypothetical protein